VETFGADEKIRPSKAFQMFRFRDFENGYWTGTFSRGSRFVKLFRRDKNGNSVSGAHLEYNFPDCSWVFFQALHSKYWSFPPSSLPIHSK
jgi:hypothetical protein